MGSLRFMCVCCVVSVGAVCVINAFQSGQLKEDLNIFIEYKASNMIIKVWR